ncbi:MAG: rRNA maturation RNase YbeY [Minisyncoccales bacterium]
MIEINNLTDFKVEEEKIKAIAEAVLEKEKQKDINLSIAFVKSDKIKEANKKYRKKDEATDVLSFGSLEDNFAEVLICPDVLGKKNLMKEISFRLIHGILHILGYDHKKNEKEKKKMYNLQEKYLNNFFNK